MERIIIENLTSVEYEHPYDRKALAILKKTPGIDKFIKKFWELSLEKLYKIQFTGSYLRINKDNLPDLYNIYSETCEILNVNKIPALYVYRNYEFNAYSIGVENPIIVLNSSILDFLSNDELRFVIGHELGHVKSEHLLYHNIANIFPSIGKIFNSTPIVGLVTLGLQTAITNWARMSEFSSDRAGLLACQDKESAANTFIKIAGLPQKYFSEDVTKGFIKQANDFMEFDYDYLNKLVKYLSTINMTHPWTVMRAAELFKWYDVGEYNDILNADPEKRSINYNKYLVKCPKCENKLNKSDSYCGKCGYNIIRE
jgi:Zn-dependent protease with chaperone function